MNVYSLFIFCCLFFKIILQNVSAETTQNPSSSDEIPIIYLFTDSQNINDDYIKARFQLKSTNQTTDTLWLKIRIRGANARTYPKKSFRIELIADSTGNSTKKISLLGMRPDDDWNLNAMYNEPLRLNTITANELWLDIFNSGSYNYNNYGKAGIDVKYVQLYTNNIYQGIYILTERIDRKQLNLNEEHGELYKTFDHSDAALFKKAHPFDNNSIYWDGIEMKYPKNEINWENLYELVHFVTKSNEEDFLDDYTYKMDLENIIDYYIFLNLCGLTDNTGKNLYIAKNNKKRPYYYVPWDLDGIFGFEWSGNFYVPNNIILTNGLYDRLMKDCHS